MVGLLGVNLVREGPLLEIQGQSGGGAMRSHRIIGHGIFTVTGILFVISLSLPGNAQTPGRTTTESPATVQTPSLAGRQDLDSAALSRGALPVIIKEAPKAIVKEAP